MSADLPDLEQLSALLDQLETADTEPPPERREHPRTPAHDKVPVTAEIAGRPALTGTLRDISKGGVGLTLPVALEPGTSFVFRSSIGPRAVQALCRVANCRPTADGRRFLVGAKIVPVQRSTAPSPAGPTAAAGSPLSTAPDVDQQHLAEVRQRLINTVARS